MDPVVIVTSTQKDWIPHFLQDGAIQFWKVHTTTFQNQLLHQYPRFKDDQSVGKSKKLMWCLTIWLKQRMRFKRLCKVSNSCCKAKPFGHDQDTYTIQKNVRIRTHRKHAHEVQSKQRHAATYVSHCFRTHMCDACYKNSHKKLKLMFNPSGLSMPSMKINFISWACGCCCCHSTVSFHRPCCHPVNGRWS